MPKDRLIVAPVQRIAVGAVLAQPDAVAETGPADDVAHGSVSRGRGCKQQQ
jgi:hypothetical protein